MQLFINMMNMLADYWQISRVDQKLLYRVILWRVIEYCAAIEQKLEAGVVPASDQG